MTNQNIIYRFFILTLLVTSYGCQHKTANDSLNISSKNEAIKKVDNVNRKSILVEEPAVIYKSNDMGMTWSSFANGIPKDATLSGIKQHKNKIYVTTDYQGVYVTTDGQNNWTSLNTEQLKNLDINCIEVEANKLIIGTLRNGVLVSNDGGLSWKQSRKNIENSPVRAFIRLRKKLYAGTDSGIFESTDFGNSWSHILERCKFLVLRY